MRYIQHPFIAEGKVEERRYQVDMAKGCVNRNTLIILPTGLGKTIIALIITAEFIQSGKVMILAPTRPLVDQHRSTLCKFLTNVSVGMVTGDIDSSQRARIINSCSVIVSTPQSIANDIKAGRYCMDSFSLVIYDEAHRGVGNYAYVYISRYCSRLRSIGLTASPGGNINNIKKVCFNLNLSCIDIRFDDDPDVIPYIHNTFVSRVEVNMPKDMVDVISLLKSMLHHYISELISLGLIRNNVSLVSTRYMLDLSRNLRDKIASGYKTQVIFKGVTIQSICVRILHAINLTETQGISILKKYLEKIVSESKMNKNSMKIISSDEFIRIVKIISKTNIEHPKISRIMSIVSNAIHCDNKSKIIIFTQYRETCEILATKLQMISGAKIEKLFGQSNKGLNQKQQIQILDRFRNGECNIVISTSVGEEGLDIPNTNIVIFYEPVPSEIRTVQRRGRTGRKKDGKVFVLITRGTLDEVFDISNKQKEELMRLHLIKLSNDLRCINTIKNIHKQISLDEF